MKKIKYLSSFFIAFVFGVFVMYSFSDFELANKISEIKDRDKNHNYYQDVNGNVWASKDEYLKYQDENYYVAPDGTYWENEYRYEQSKN
jgi:hypothetical protein